MSLEADKNQDESWRGNGKAFRGRRKTIFEAQFSNEDSKNVFNEEFKRFGSEHYTKQSDVSEIQQKEFKVPSSEQVKKAFGSPPKVVQFTEKDGHLENVAQNKPANENFKSFSNQSSPKFRPDFSSGFKGIRGRPVVNASFCGKPTGFGNKQFGSGANNIPVLASQSGNQNVFGLQNPHNDNFAGRGHGSRRGEYNNRASGSYQRGNTSRGFGGNNSFNSASMYSGFGANAEVSKQGFKPLNLDMRYATNSLQEKEVGRSDANINVTEPEKQINLSKHEESSTVIKEPKQKEVEPTVEEPKQKEVESTVEKPKQKEVEPIVEEPKQVDVQMKSDGSIAEGSKDENIQAKADGSTIDLEVVETKDEGENSQALSKTDGISFELDEHLTDQNAKDLLQKFFIITLRDGKAAIVKFTVGDNIVNVSKLHFSAQSPVFERLMQENSEESETIKADNFSLEAVKQFANYIHFGKVENLDELDVELLNLAKTYEVNELENICEKHISSNALSNENIFQRLVEAFKTKNQMKQDFAVDYVIRKNGTNKHFKEIIVSEEWRKFTQENSELAYEICTAVFEKL